MNIAIVGASSAGIYLAIFLKRAHPEADVVLLEQNARLGRKLLATGNGHGNLLNLKTSAERFNHPDYMRPLLERYDFGTLQTALADIGVILTDEGNYVYPLSYSAPAHVAYLEKLLASLKVKTLLGVKVKEYHKAGDKWVLDSDHGPLLFDRVYFATGGASTPKLGSDGSLFPVFAKHGYQIVPLKPGLCPLKSKEPTKAISGYRHHAMLYLTLDGVLGHQEEGEVLFKDDGISGIVVFNAASFLARRKPAKETHAILDLFPNVKLGVLVEDLFDSASKHPDFFLSAYFPDNVGRYLLSRAGVSPSEASTKKGCYRLAKTMKGLDFTITGSYGFENSQVSVGGISLNEVDRGLSSLREKGVSFVGEVLDVDGDCGGFNLTWCLVSALIAVSSFPSLSVGKAD